MVTVRRSSTTERGYGSKHQKLRRRWKPKVDAGQVDCARCGRPIAAKGFPCRRCLARGKTVAQAVRCRWDLGHDDIDRTVWTGPEHSCCNRQTATHKIERQAHRGLPSWWKR